MRVRILLLLVFTALLGACSGSRELTLGDMARRQIVIDLDQPVTAERQDAIRYYRSLMEFDIDNRFRARAMKRLADLELEGGVQKEVNNSESLGPDQIREYRTSVEIYKDLLKQYPEFPGNDQVLYQLAQAYERLGMLDESMVALTRLAKDFPSSPLYDEVQFRRGEIFFVEGEYDESAKAFQSVIQFGQTSRFYELALHKHGWDLLKLDRFDDALNSFFTLLDVKFAPLTLNADPFAPLPVVQTDQELIDDTLYAVALVFSYVNSVDYIEKLIAKRGRKNYDHVIYHTLADFYMRQKRYQEAANVYTTYAVRYTTEPQAAFFKLKLIDIYKQAGLADASLNAKKHFVQVYGPNTNFWISYGDTVRGQLMPKVKVVLTELTQYYHALAQKDRSDANYRTAENWYRAYLRSVPADGDTPKIHFLLADLLYEGKRFADASKEYESVAYDYPANDKGQEAGYAAILAYRDQMRAVDPARKQEWSDKQIASVLRYSDRYPEDPRIAKLMTTLAQETYGRKEYDKARLLAQRVIAMGENSAPDLSLMAWIVNAHSDFETGSYAKAESSYRKTMELANKLGSVKPEMFDWLAASIYKQAEAKQAAGVLADAVEDYLRIGAAAPKSDIRTQAEYDAATVLIDMKSWERAITTLEQFRANYPNHRLQQEVPLKLAVAYLEAGQRLKAAEQYDQIARSSYAPEIRREAAWQAADIFEKERQSDRSAALYEYYVQHFPDPYHQRVEGRYRLSQLYLAMGQRDKYNAMINQLVTADEPGNPGHNDRSRYLVAQAALNLAETKLDEFRNVQLVEPLAQNLKTKKARMEEALSAYNKAANYRVAEVVTASTYRIGEIYYQFSKNLMESERPKDLNPEELEQYNVMLEEQAFPFEEKAIAILESNAKRASGGVYDNWIKKSYGKLKELMPARYSKAEKGGNIVEALQ